MKTKLVGYMTVREVAKRLKVSEVRVRVFCRQGRLASVEVHDRLRLIDPESVEAFRRKQRPPGRPRKTA